MSAHKQPLKTKRVRNRHVRARLLPSAFRARRHAAGGRGLFIAVVGPDGVGKTTLCEALLQAYKGPTGYCHFRPPLWGRLSGAIPKHDSSPQEKTRLSRDEPPSRSYLAAPGWLRLARSLLHLWVGYLTSIRPLLEQHGLVVADRWGYGYWAQPAALRYHGPVFLARHAIRLMPRPDIVVNLTAPADVILCRKQELSMESLRRELKDWQSLPLPAVWTLSSDKATAAELAEHILRSPEAGLP